MDKNNEKKITVTLTPGTSKIVRKMATRRGVDIKQIIAHAFMLEYWAEAADMAGDEICIKNGKTGRITAMNFPWPKPECRTESSSSVAVKKPYLHLVANNPNPQSSPFHTSPNLQPVPDCEEK